MKIIKLILIASLLASCAGLPGRNVKLENYPKITNEEYRNLSIGYKKINFDLADKNKKFTNNFDLAIISELKLKNIFEDKNNTHACVIRISSINEEQSYLAAGYQAFATVTLFIFPYYWQHTYQAHATLISTSDNRILKEYDLKDKVHEVWSSLWMLNPWSWNEPSPEYGKKIVEETISEALTRSVLSDAAQFPECQK